MKKLPKMIMVRWVEIENDEPYLSASESLEDLIEDEEAIVGVYTLTSHTWYRKVVQEVPRKQL